MKTILRISIFLNCALTGCLAFLLLNGRPARPRAEAPAEAENPPPVAEGAMPAHGASPLAEVRPFHWSQIESADYRTYIANLRAIGCPEQTIHDLVKADVDSLYASRRRLVEDKLAKSDVAGRTALQRELQQLGDQEASAVTALLAAPSAAANTTSAPPAAISLPLAFHEIDPSVVNLNPEQAQAVNDLRQKFIQDVGGLNQDPNDPAYSQRWQASQPQADLDLCGMLGINAFQSYQIAAWAKAHDQTPSGQE